jgi:hypothetical protein
MCDTVASQMRDTPAMLRELKVVEQRYHAVLEVLDGIRVTVPSVNTLPPLAGGAGA